MTKVTMNELAAHWRIGYSTIFKWMARHEDFPRYYETRNRSKANYFYKEEVEEWINKKFN